MLLEKDQYIKMLDYNKSNNKINRFLKELQVQILVQSI